MCKAEELTMLAAALQRLNDAGHFQVPIAAEVTGLDSSTIHRWMGGHTRPGFEAVSLLVKHYPSPIVRNELMRIFAGGAPMLVVMLPRELDVNGDGRVDADDALDSAINTSQQAGSFLRCVRDAMRDRRIEDHELVQSDVHIDEAIGELARARAVLGHVHANQPRRHQLGGNGKSKPSVIARGGR